MAEEKEIELKTEDVNELLTSVPNWIIRWGVTMIFCIMVAALALSYFIKYPDTLTAKATITTINPPVTLVSKANGKIIELKVKNNQSVKKDEVLFVIESAANYNSILAIDTILKDFDKNDSLNYIKLNRLSLLGKHGEGLGGITPMFIVFFKSYNDYKLQKELNPQIKEVEIIDKELAEYQALQGKYQNQENIYKEEFSLIEKDFNRFTTLFSNQSISAKEFEDKKREFLSAKRNYESIKITNINNKLAINNLEKNKLQLQMQAYQEIEKFEKTLSQSVQSLKSEIETCEQAYLLKAPIEGKVSLFNYWAINQNIKQGDEILSIVPSIKQEIIAKLFLPVQNSSKLKIGQTVNIKLDNYQFQEFGMLKGRVENVSLVPQKDTYAIEVSLPNNLITSYNKQLVYKEEMQGTADIITEELSVFDRVFYQFRKILK
jgi:multidrug resistance efflux pump